MDAHQFDRLTRAVAERSSRRGLLRGLGATLTLAAVGRHASRAAAKGGRFGGQLGGRHGKNQRGRDKHRKRKRHHHKKKRRGGMSGNPLGGGAPLMNVRVIVENQTKSPFDAEGWVYNGAMRRCQKRSQETIQPSLTATFALETPRPFVWVKGKYLINVQDAHPEDALPYACLYQGGTMSQYCYDYDNDDFCHLEGCKELEVGQKWVTPANACRDRIEIQRDADVDNERVFRVRVIA
jgi:hypothetical protein